jgi:DNA-binding transcriptional ArsR family regulator
MQWVFGGCRHIHDGPRLVLLSLAWLADKSGEGEMKIESLGFMAVMSRSSVQRHLRVLEDEGVLTRDAARGRGRSSHFQLHLESVSENRSENRSTNRSAVTRYAENMSENRSENVAALTRYDDSHLLSTRLQDNNPERAARARACEGFAPSPRILEELAHRGFPPVEFEGLLADYRRKRATDGDDLTDANFRKYALYYLRDVLHRTDHGDLSETRIGPKTAAKVGAAFTWAQKGEDR